MIVPWQSLLFVIFPDHKSHRPIMLASTYCAVCLQSVSCMNPNRQLRNEETIRCLTRRQAPHLSLSLHMMSWASLYAFGSLIPYPVSTFVTLDLTLLFCICHINTWVYFYRLLWVRIQVGKHDTSLSGSMIIRPEDWKTVSAPRGPTVNNCWNSFIYVYQESWKSDYHEWWG